jgi:putative sigma-54 modulation protein
MEYIIKARNMELDESVRNYAEKKIKNKVNKYLDKAIKIEVKLNFEKNPKINLNNLAEVTVFTGGSVIRATDSGMDMFEAIDKVSSKIERQIKKYRNKIIQRGRKNFSSKVVPEKDIEEKIKKQIVKIKNFAIKPVTPEEAVIQMEMLGHDFFVFINSESEKTAVIYRRKDNNYGLIEPSV